VECLRNLLYCAPSFPPGPTVPRHWITALLAWATLTATLTAMSEVVAQSDRPGRIVVGGPPGSAQDLLARIFAEKFRESAGRQYIVENRAGASSTIAVDSVARSAPDGGTLLISAIGPLLIEPAFAKNIPYDTFRDLTPISQISTAYVVYAISPRLQAKSLEEFLGLVRGNAKLGFYSTAGTNGIPYLFSVLLQRHTGIAMTNVPYKSAADAVKGVASGEVPAGALPMGESMPLYRRGQLRIVATSGPSRSTLLPEVPTFRELGYRDLEAETWYGLLAPANLPRTLLESLSKAAMSAMQQKEVRDTLAGMGLEVTGTTPEEFMRIMKRDAQRWTAAVKTTGVKRD
jgi:tripartite-type tricarboxylate transporter receptor subunit TctC